MESKSKITPIESDNLKLESNEKNDHDDSAKKDAYEKKRILVINIIRAVICRAVAIAIYSYSVAFMLCAIQFSYKYSFLVYILPIIIIISDTLNICIRRKGKEYDW